MRAFRIVIAALLLAIASVNSAFALSINAPNIIWNPAVQGTPSGNITVQVANPTADPTLLAGWQLDLALQQVSGSGTLEFANDSIASLGASYVMFGNSSGLFSTLTPTSIFAFDFDPPGPPLGVTVPVSGKAFLNVNFSTPNNAQGVWNLIAVAGPGLTQWSDSNGNDVDFTNVPSSGQSVVIGTITVVPEPSTIVLVGLGGLAMGIAAWSRRRNAA